MVAGLGATKAIWPSRFLPYIGVLIASKFFRSFGLFLSYDLLKLIHVVQFLFLIKLGSSTFFIVLQKPFSSGKRITKNQWFRITRHAFLGSLIQLLWLFGLTLCGPLRTLMLFEHSDFAVIAGISALFNSVGGPAKFRGGVFFVLGILGVLLFDHDGLHLPDSGHSDGSHHSSIITHLFDHITHLTGLSDHKGGVVLLVVTLCLQVGYSSAAKKLSVDIGGSKRLNALSTFVSTVLLLPWALFLFSTTQSAVESWPWLLFPIVLVVLTVFVIDYYVEGVCCTHMDFALTGRIGTMAILVSAMVISAIWNHPFVSSLTTMQFAQDVTAEDHILSGGVVFSFVLFLFATHILTSGAKTTQKGSLIGYSAAGLPLYNFNGEAFHRTSHSVMMVLKNGLRQILEESDSRKIFYFLCVNLSFTFIELVYGVWTNSLGLISDGFHMLFDCSALVMGLYAAIMSRWKATRIFSYGYDRVEILSGFINGLFLVVIAFFVFMAAFARIFDPPEIKTERLLTVSVAGLVVNLFGIMAFRHTHSHGGMSHGHSHGGHGHSHSHGGSQGGSHGHSHGAHGNSQSSSSAPRSNNKEQSSITHNTNMQGVFLHVLADTLGSVGVIISTLLIENFNMKIADPICSLFIALLIGVSVMPLLKETSMVLLLHTPDENLEQLQGALHKVLSIEGVLSYRDEHCWKHSSSVTCGTIHVQVQPDVNEQKIITQVTSIFKEIGVSNMTVQVEKQTFFQHISGLGVSLDQVIEMTKNLKALNYDNSSVFIKAI